MPDPQGAAQLGGPALTLEFILTRFQLFFVTLNPWTAPFTSRQDDLLLINRKQRVVCLIGGVMAAPVAVSIFYHVFHPSTMSTMVPAAIGAAFLSGVSRALRRLFTILGVYEPSTVFLRQEVLHKWRKRRPEWLEKGKLFYEAELNKAPAYMVTSRLGGEGLPRLGIPGGGNLSSRRPSTANSSSYGNDRMLQSLNSRAESSAGGRRSRTHSSASPSRRSFTDTPGLQTSIGKLNLRGSLTTKGRPPLKVPSVASLRDVTVNPSGTRSPQAGGRSPSAHATRSPKVHAEEMIPIHTSREESARDALVSSRQYTGFVLEQEEFAQFRPVLWTVISAMCVVGTIMGVFIGILAISVSMTLEPPLSTGVILVIGSFGTCVFGVIGLSMARMLHYRLASTLALLSLAFEGSVCLVLKTKNLPQFLQILIAIGSAHTLCIIVLAYVYVKLELVQIARIDAKRLASSLIARMSDLSQDDFERWGKVLRDSIR